MTLTRPSADAAQTSQRLTVNSLPPTSSIPPAALSGTAPLSSYPVQTNRTSPATNKSLSPIASKPPGLAVTTAPKTQSPAQNAAVLPQDSSQDKLAEQVKLVRIFFRNLKTANVKKGYIVELLIYTGEFQFLFLTFLVIFYALPKKLEIKLLMKSVFFAKCIFLFCISIILVTPDHSRCTVVVR